MSDGEIAFLAMVIAALAIFGASLFWASTSGHRH
jgi:hypothetical protein